MSLTYTGTNGVFTQIGKLVKHYNKIKDNANDATDGLDANQDEILDVFQAADQDVAIDGLVPAFKRWKAEAISRREELAQYVVSRLQDEETILKELGMNSADIDQIVNELIAEMDANNKTVEESNFSLGSVSEGSSNEGGGKILVTDILDGATSPGSFNGVRMPANLKYKGKTSELGGNETFRFKVTADSYQDGLNEGSEEISWQGCPRAEPHGLDDGGSGYVGTIQPLHASTEEFLANADFEVFTTNSPDNWDVVNGTVGTDILQENTVIAQGESALKFSGGGSAIEIKQDISADSVIANKMYCVSVKLRRSDVPMPSMSNVTVQFEGTGYSAGGTEQVSQTFGSLNTVGFEVFSFFVVMPSIIPDDFALVLKWDGGPSSGELVYFDDLSMGPVNYGGGIGVVAVRDSGTFVRGDRFEVSTTTTEGVFQEFFRRVLGAQLPSSASPTISDSLATT